MIIQRQPSSVTAKPDRALDSRRLFARPTSNAQGNLLPTRFAADAGGKFLDLDRVPHRPRMERLAHAPLAQRQSHARNVQDCWLAENWPD
jgi:hypothetical protein